MPTDPAHGAKGPSLMDVVGRTAGSIRGWDFSPALRASGLEFHPRPKPYLVWTEANLDKWLTDSGVFVPGSRHMNLKMPDPLERAKVIAYLRSLTKPIDGASLP
jgi:cytochrome c